MTILPAAWAGTQRAPVTCDYSASRESWDSRLHASAGPDVHVNVVPKCGRTDGRTTACSHLTPTPGSWPRPSPKPVLNSKAPHLALSILSSGAAETMQVSPLLADSKHRIPCWDRTQSWAGTVPGSEFLGAGVQMAAGAWRSRRSRPCCTGMGSRSSGTCSAVGTEGVSAGPTPSHLCCPLQSHTQSRPSTHLPPTPLHKRTKFSLKIKVNR